MSELYSIQDTTLTALGDAIRNKTSKYIYKDTPWEEPIYSIDYDSRDYDIANDWQYSSSNLGYWTEINIPLKELLGDTLSMYNVSGIIGRPKFLINFTYESNMEKSLTWDFCVTPKTGGTWYDRYVSESSTFLTRELIDRLVEPSNNNRDFSDKYYIYMVVLQTSIEKGYWFKFHFDIKVITANNKYVYLNTYTPLEMVDKINGLMTIPDEALSITGSCNYRFAYNNWNWFIKLNGNKITTSNLFNPQYMFNESNKLEEIPFDLNMSGSYSHATNNMFFRCFKLKNIPMIYGLKLSGSNSSMFQECQMVRYFPEHFAEDWDFTDLNNYAYGGMTYLVSGCCSLRKVPTAVINNFRSKSVSSYSSCYVNTFNDCFSLDDINGVDVVVDVNATSNMFNNSFTNCSRVLNITFLVNNDGTPKTANWKSQTIDLTSGVGYITQTYFKQFILNYNSGITADKEVKDDATYQALKNDPDWFSCDINYSRYNHDSAVRTINSLPDTSAYLTANGGTNTIKFKGQSGALTDGGAINTLTEEEIAVATAKGWTVSLV